VEVPLVAIVSFHGDKLYNEHIYWDQASVLVQIGKLDPAGLPVAGIETARKLLDKTLPSNTLMAAWANSETGRCSSAAPRLDADFCAEARRKTAKAWAF
jgi:carboxymethylenebutenolidase